MSHETLQARADAANVAAYLAEIGDNASGPTPASAATATPAADVNVTPASPVASSSTALPSQAEEDVPVDEARGKGWVVVRGQRPGVYTT